MTRQSALLHSVLCVLAVAFAWQAAHEVKAKKGGPSSVVLLDADKNEVSEVLYTWDKGSTHTRLEGLGKSRVAVVDVDREVPVKKKEPPKKDRDDHEAAPLEPEPPPAPAEHEKATLPGGKSVLSAIEALEPLKSKRTLDAVDDAKLEAMGLKTPLRTLVVTTRGGKTLTLDLGEQSYGAQGRYARVKGQSTVHLIDSAIATGLEGGSDALLEKRLLTAELESIRGFSLKTADASSGETRRWLHVDKDQVSTRFFAKSDDPTVKDEAAGKLMTTLRNLRAAKLASTEVQKGPAVVKATFVVDVDAAAVTIEILERGDQGHLGRVGPWVFELTATQTKELLDDIEAVLGG